MIFIKCKGNKNRIIYYTAALTSGGAERQFLYTALSAEKSGYEVMIIIDDPTNHYKEMIKGSNIEIFCTYASKKTPLKKFFRLISMINKFRPMVFHSFLTTKNLWGMFVSKICKVPVRIASIRNTDKWSFKYVRIYSKWSSKIICNSKLAFNIASEEYNIPKNKLDVVYNGIDLENCNIDFGNKMKKEIDEKEKMVGITVARIAYQKNHVGLMNAIGILKRKGLTDHLRYLLVGNNVNQKIYNDIEMTIKKNNIGKIVSYLGIKGNIFDILKKCDFLVLPSFFEGFPNVVMEAMATKTFVIATPTGGTPELIKDGVNGILCKSTGSDDIAYSIERYLRMSNWERQKIIDNAFENINNFSVEKMFKKTESIYHQELNKIN